MGTLYECLREARLEQFYPAFRANGITRSEALINLGMPEFFALGITSSEDKRRLIELVNIIKSVHRQRQPHSSNTNFTNSSYENSPTSGRATQNVRSQRSPNSRGSANREVGTFSVPQLDPSRDVSLQERVPNYSLATYMNLLRQISESSESDAAAGDHSDQEQAAAQSAYRSTTSPSTVRNSASRGAAIERIHHSKRNSYNYGVHKVSSSGKATYNTIKVCVRKRPLTRRELRAKEEDIVHTESTNTLIVNEPKLAVDLKAYTLQHEFIFDEVFDEKCTNEDVYLRAARPLISCIFNGGTATCFAYGQTGAGKTHTMLGGENVPGLYLLAGQDIFSIIQAGTYGRGLHVWVSFFEIYCGQLFDLLNRRNRLQAREDGSRQVCIAGLTETEATSVNSLVQILQYGNSVRSKGASGVNPDSSRSHAILQLDIRNSEDVKVGKISFIDLAGSERASDVTDTDKQTRIEGAEINQSLLALKECIRSIDQDSRHTPFRQSKLTHILKDSFVGNSRTCMIANISPTQPACENTLNTLRYADRVKELRRDSSKSSSVGQAMNLLMNIPPTAPSIFHPSNILSSSTPVRVSSHPRRERSQTPVDLHLDPAETPLRGHNLQRKQKEKTQHGQPLVHAATGQSRTDCMNLISSVPQIPPAIFSRSSAHATAASQGSSAPPPDASPSESDQTDTDSCNVTHPVSTVARTSNRFIPVTRSTDTEFDFPTSDFNNIENINDLNRATFQEAQPIPGDKSPHILSQIPTVDSAVSAAAAAAAAEVPATPTLSSNIKPPVLRPVVYRSMDSSTEIASAELFLHTPQIAGFAKKIHSPSLVSPQMSRHTPNFKKSQPEDLDTSNDSIDEDELFCEGLDAQTAAQGMNNLGAPSAVSVLATSRTVSASVITKNASVPLTLDEGDVAVLSQEHYTKLTENSTKSEIGINKQVSSISLYPVGAPTQLEQLSHKTQSDSSQKNQLPQPKMTVSPTPRQYPMQGDKPANEDTDSVLSYASQHQPLSRQLPQQRGHSPSSDHSSSFPVKQKNASCYKCNEDSIHGSNIQYHSDGSDCGSHQKTSPSPTGEASGDSMDSIRASFSDQGQGEHRHHSKTSMRKGRNVNGCSKKEMKFFFIMLTHSCVHRSAIVTEKLSSGAVFSPIHPPPATNVQSRSSVGCPTSSLELIQPTPVTAVFTQNLGTIVGAQSVGAEAMNSTQFEEKMQLVAAHEDQLATVTSLCKYEMRLLLNAKKVMGKRGFDDYLRPCQ
ncbi:unnamed protein product [Candidula unifasciata]|uniref:Kinesin motor domain-containing protein n=1 Tax=Candidula unifasciata TaxID=100452 RepID=A0A8S3ZIJ6_9EUPU|nr:unnamed protein product [Candidula unifasciata]